MYSFIQQIFTVLINCTEVGTILGFGEIQLWTKSLSSWSLQSNTGRYRINKQTYSMSDDKKYCGENTGRGTGNVSVCAFCWLLSRGRWSHEWRVLEAQAQPWWEEQRTTWNDWPLSRTTVAAREKRALGLRKGRGTSGRSDMIQTRTRVLDLEWEAAHDEKWKCKTQCELHQKANEAHWRWTHRWRSHSVSSSGKRQPSGNVSVTPTAYQKRLWNQQKKVLMEQVWYKMCLGKNHVWFIQLKHYHQLSDNSQLKYYDTLKSCFRI